MVPISIIIDNEDDELQMARENARQSRKRLKENVEIQTNSGENIELGFVDADDDVIHTSGDESEPNRLDYFNSSDNGSYYSDIDVKHSDIILRRHNSLIRFDPNSKVPVFFLRMVFQNMQQRMQLLSMQLR